MGLRAITGLRTDTISRLESCQQFADHPRRFDAGQFLI
jgi:hypothetical protein